MLPGPTELALVLVIVLILFGTGKLPQVFEAFGHGIRHFRDEERDDDDPPPPAVPARVFPPERVPRDEAEREVR